MIPTNPPRLCLQAHQDNLNQQVMPSDVAE
jgi:hypothetical protein